MKIKKIFSFLLRFLITFSLLFIIYHKIDLKSVKNVLAHADYFYLFVALFIFIISNITGAIEYYFLLKSHYKNKPIQFFYIIKIYLFSAFFNNFLPTNVGGDTVKIYKLIKAGHKKEIIFSSILWDRFIGIIILILMSLITGFILLKQFLLLFALFLFVFLALIFVLLINKFNLGKLILKITSRIHNTKIQYFLKEFFISFKTYLKKSFNIQLFYLISIITQFLKIYFNCYVAKALNLPIAFLAILFVMPIIGIISALPISINGFGIREYMGSILFKYIHSSISIIPLFITLINIVIMLANSFGIIFIFNQDENNQK